MPLFTCAASLVTDDLDSQQWQMFSDMTNGISLIASVANPSNLAKSPHGCAEMINMRQESRDTYVCNGRYIM